MSKKLINCTPHEIVLVDDAGNVLQKIPASPTQIRVVSKNQPRELPFQFLGVPVVESTQFDSYELTGPVPDDGEMLIVSMPVGEYFKSHTSRWWIFGPDSGPQSVQRTQSGQICGVRRLTFYQIPVSAAIVCPMCGNLSCQVAVCGGCGIQIENWMAPIDGTKFSIVLKDKLERHAVK